MLKDILYKVSIRSVVGNTNIEVADLQIDSRKVSNGSCFIAIKGVSTDGHQFIDIAIANGASAIVCDQLPGNINDGVTYVQVENTSEAAGLMAHNFYGEPSLKTKTFALFKSR